MNADKDMLRQQAGRVDAFAPIPEAKDAPTGELWNAYSAFNERYRGFNTQQALRDAINTVLANRATLADGMVLVPREPTESMVVDGFESAPDPVFSSAETWDEYEAMTGCQQAAHRARLCWAAMIARYERDAAALSQRAEVK